MAAAASVLRCSPTLHAIVVIWLGFGAIYGWVAAAGGRNTDFLTHFVMARSGLVDSALGCVGTTAAAVYSIGGTAQRKAAPLYASYRLVSTVMLSSNVLQLTERSVSTSPEDSAAPVQFWDF